MVHAPTWRPVEFTKLADGASLERAGHAAVVDGTNVYIIGGRKGRAFYNDVLKFDTRSRSWERVPAEGSERFEKRGNHTATLIGRDIWVLGGSNNEAIFSDVCVFNIDSRRWSFPAVRGNMGLLCRSAHGADVHPLLPTSIIIMGGYGGISSTYIWTNDTVVLHTDRLQLEALAVQGERPSPRGYHTLTTLGPHCVVIGGRTEEGRIQGRQLVAVLDPATSTWHLPKHSDGLAPQARSSHRAVALTDRIILHGGAAGENDPNRLGDVATLHLPAPSRLQWSYIDQPAPSSSQPQGRAAHTTSLVGNTVYIISGYAGQRPGAAKYISDCWALDLPPRAGRGQQAGLGALAAPVDVASEVPFVTRPSARATQQHGAGNGAWATAVSEAAAGRAAAQDARDRAQERQGRNSGREAPDASPPKARSPQPSGAGGRVAGGKRELPVDAGEARGSGPTARKLQAIEIPDSPPAGAGTAAQRDRPPRPQERLHLQPQHRQERQQTGRPATPPAPQADQTAAAAVARIAALEAELDHSRAQVHQQSHYTNYQLLEKELTHLRRQRDELTSKLDAADQAREDRDRQCVDLQQQLSATAKDLGQCRARLGDQEQAAAAAAKLHAHVASELAALREARDAMQAALKQAEARLEERTRELEWKLEERTRDLESERQTRMQLQATVASLGKSAEQLQARLQSAEEALISERRGAAEAVEHSRAAAREQEAALDAARLDLRTCQAKLVASESAMQQSRNEVVEAQVRLRELQEAGVRAEAEARNLQNELAAARQQLQDQQETARQAQDWFRHMEGVFRGGAALLLPRPGGVGSAGTSARQPP